MSTSILSGFKNFINHKYLNPVILNAMASDFNTRSPVSYYVIDNFLDESLFSEVEKEFDAQSWVFFTPQKRINHFISNKTILLWTPNFLKLYNFFLSPEFENFLEIFYKKSLKKSKKITSDFIFENYWLEWQWVAQIYQHWDFMSWHTDIAKDLEREESISRWWYKEWDKVQSTKFDEVWAFIYYVYNSETDWSPSNWWILEVWKITDEINDIVPYKTVSPLRNRLVLIKSSNQSYHRVTEIVAKSAYRISIQDLLINKNATLWKELL